MKEAGLTHGGFYSHFGSKTDLVVEALETSIAEQLDSWTSGLAELPTSERIPRLINRYLSRRHRDAVDAGCPIPSTCAEVAHASEPVRRAYDEVLRASVERIEEIATDPECEDSRDHAIGMLAVCVGGLLLARAAGDPGFSDDILRSCRDFATQKTQG